MAGRAPIHRVTLEEWKASIQRDPSRDTRPKYATGEVVQSDDVVTVAGHEGEHRLFWAFLASEVPRKWRVVVETIRPDPELELVTLIRRNR